VINLSTQFADQFSHAYTWSVGDCTTQTQGVFGVVAVLIESYLATSITDCRLARGPDT